MKLLLEFFVWSCHGMTCKRCLAKLLLKLWRGHVMQRLPCKAMSQSFAWNSRAKAALRSNFVSFCIELSCKLLHGTFVHKVALRSSFLSFCMGLSCKSCLMKLFFSSCMGEMQTLPSKTISQAFTWNCRAKVAFRSYLLSSELSRKS